jgi:hypothetical protein
MKQFFRLLIICFGLLLVLGLNEKQSGDSIPVTLSSSSHIFFEFSACTFLSAANGAIELWLSPHVQVLPDHYPQTKIQREHTISTGIQTHILSTRENLMEYFPGVPGKTGYFLHFPAHRGDPSLA